MYCQGRRKQICTSWSDHLLERSSLARVLAAFSQPWPLAARRWWVWEGDVSPPAQSAETLTPVRFRDHKVHKKTILWEIVYIVF